jgi:diguanylate cyclase (GGDEF)-like protein
MSPAAAKEPSASSRRSRGSARDRAVGKGRASRKLIHPLSMLAVAATAVVAVCVTAGYFFVLQLDSGHAELQRQHLAARIDQVRVLSGEIASHLAHDVAALPASTDASDAARLLAPTSALHSWFEKAFVFDDNGSAFAVHPPSTPTPPAVARLVAELRERLPGGEGAGGVNEDADRLADLAVIDGAPAIVAVARIGGGTALTRLIALATVTPLDENLLSRMAQAVGVEDLSADQAAGERSRMSHVLSDRRGRIVGWLSWIPDRPVLNAVQRTAPLIAIVAACFIAFGVMVIQQLGKNPRGQHDDADLDETDALTGIAGRAQILKALDRALASHMPTEIVLFAVANLDGFTEINDNFGYRAGDTALIAVANRLREGAPPSATVGRLGGDEFAIVMMAGSLTEALTAANDIVDALSHPIAIGSNVAQLGVCVGLALAPRDGETCDEIVRRAELAMRAAKRQGRNSIVGFDLAIEQEIQDRRFIMRALRNAIAEDALQVHYQPIVAAASRRVVGVEALLRWRHRTRGEIPPEMFVPIAEQAGLMPQLGEFVLRRAIADAARWKGLFLSINLSPLQVRDPRLVELVGSILRQTGMAANRVVLEITEGVLIDEPENAIKRLERLRALGVKIALDDFGSGYSSLKYLQRFPIDKLKIDMSFIEPLGKSGSAGVIVQAIVALGRALNLVVLAEGVETEEQQMLLRLAGCDELQGHLFSKSLTAAEVDGLLAREAQLAASVLRPVGATAVV